MKVVKKTETNTYRFNCKYCGCTLEAHGGEFEFVKPGVLKYQCLVCNEQRRIKEKAITIIENYEPSKNPKEKS